MSNPSFLDGLAGAFLPRPPPPPPGRPARQFARRDRYVGHRQNHVVPKPVRSYAGTLPQGAGPHKRYAEPVKSQVRKLTRDNNQGDGRIYRNKLVRRKGYSL